MPEYVDGFLLPVPKKKLTDYRRVARQAAKIWKKFGALDYRECVGDDVNVKGFVPFTKIAGAKKGEVVVLAWIIYKSKKHRDEVNAKVMKDPTLTAMAEECCKIFDCKRMAYGGFETLVSV